MALSVPIPPSPRPAVLRPGCDLGRRWVLTAYCADCRVELCLGRTETSRLHSLGLALGARLASWRGEAPRQAGVWRAVSAACTARAREPAVPARGRGAPPRPGTPGGRLSGLRSHPALRAGGEGGAPTLH